MKTRVCVIAAMVLAIVAGLHAQRLRILVRSGVGVVTVSPTNPIAAARLPGGSAALPNSIWSTAGAGTIPSAASRPRCTTGTGTSVIAAYTGTAATINTAIAGCDANHAVELGTGTFNVSTGISFDGHSNITVRGNGADATILVFTGTAGCSGKQAYVCINSASSSYPNQYEDVTMSSFGNSANWTSGYAAGTTTIVLDAKTNLQVGTTLILSQLNDNGDVDGGTDVYDCNVGGVCSQGTRPATPVRTMGQFVTVTSVPGTACAPTCSIGITPSIQMPNWRSGKTPQAGWASFVFASGMGVEDLTIQRSSNGLFNVTFFNVTGSWVKGIRSTNPDTKHVVSFVSHHNTVRDSYFFGVTAPCANDHYGFDGDLGGFNLIENNIYQRMEVPLMAERGQVGNVYAYNYTIANLFDSGCSAAWTWMQASAHDHGFENSFVLYEGNDGNGTVRENYYDPPFFFTDFRNRWSGWENTGALVSQTVPVHVYSRARFHNFVGNILGTNGYHTTYESAAGGSDANCTHSIYALGFGDNCADGGSAGRPTNDTNTKPTILRWGNCDTVTGTSSCTFASGEVPSGIANYANPLPSSQALPNSLYLSAKPSFFGTVPWPPIGPDVTGGDVSGSGTSVNAGLNGRVYRIPARKCFEDTMGGTFTDTSAKTFNRVTCYGA